MRLLLTIAVAAATLTATAADARHYYTSRSHAECRRAKTRSGHTGIAVGAVAGGVGTALLGGGVGGSLLGAAAGGTAGNFIARGRVHCGDRYHAH